MKIRTLIFSLLISFLSIAQNHHQNQKPKLVVGIVVDQMRYDYLSRFYDRFGEEGFKTLMNDGFNCKNNHFNYMPTYTGPGHASIYTGTTPENHGIIANNWYDKFEKKKVYCASDDSVIPLGTDSENEKMSPRRMLTTTFADANKVHTQFKGKTIGVSIKDRGSILPAGHSADFAFWFRGAENGFWVSSNYYADKLPNWVTKFNTKKSVDKYLTTWETLYPIETYTASGKDLNAYEKGFKGKETATFPYDLSALKSKNSGYNILKASPFGNSIVADFAIEAIKNEDLGKDNITDVLTVSFSSTDYVGHNFGVNSVEIEDTYLRLDQDLARLLNTLNKEVGEGKYTVFLTADHGAVHVPQFLKDHKIPAYYVEGKEFDKKVKDFVRIKYKTDGLVANMSNNQLFFNYEKLAEANVSFEEISESVKQFITQLPNIQYVFTRSTVEKRMLTNTIGKLVQNGFHQQRSGDVMYVFTPATISYSKTGSTHGSPQIYDTHVPLLFYGSGIKKGQTFNKTEITDIAPTICAILDIIAPNASTGKILTEVME